ncbi:MAG: hypothetical protein ACREM3_26010 [Candidatus Rokuibacteriota bacterium]
MAPTRYRWLAALLPFAPVVVLVVLAVVVPRLVVRLVDEEGPVEWLQVAFCVVAAALALSRARGLARAGQSPAFDIVVAALLMAFAVAELELDRVIFGTKVIGTRFFLHPRRPVAWPWRALIALIVVGVPVAVGIYALRRIRPLVRSGLAALREPWGRLLLAGFVVFGASEALEPALARVSLVSHFFLEETAELAASACFIAAYALRPDRARSPAGHR